MKWSVACRRVLGVLIWLLLSVSIAAAVVLEDGSGTAGTYHNLTPEAGSRRINWSSPPQQQYLSQTSNTAPAQAVYPIRDTTQVEISIYSRFASFASVLEEEYIRGHWGSGTHRLQYSARSGQVYLDGLELYYDPQSPTLYGFRPAQQPDQLVDYGLNLYWSVDGQSYTWAETWLTGYQVEEGTHYYETYQGEIDPQAKYLKLLLYDHHTLPMAGREESYRYTATGDLAIARVEIDGSLYTQEAPASPEDSSSRETQEAPPSSSVPLLEGGVSSTPQFREEIIETSPDDTAVTPAFQEQELPVAQVQGGSSSGGSSVSKTSGGKSSAKKSGSSTDGAEALQGIGQLYEDEAVAAAGSPQVIRPRSLMEGEETFLDRLNTPEGIAILFFALACLLLAAKIITKV